MSGCYRQRMLLATVIVAVIVVAGCKSGSLVSTSDEVEIGRQAAADVERQYPVVTDPELNRMVSGIGENLASRNPRPGIDYTFRIIRSQEVNAFALPGGWIYVTTGLLDATRGNRDQLAGVLAHEIGHINAKHHAEMITRQQIYGIAIGTLTKGSTAQVAAIFANLNLLRWSRKQEYESDRLALQYMVGSPYNPEGLIQFLEYIQRTSNDSRSLAFLRTHPVSENRVERARQELARLRAGRS